jgi:hypothetical protein
MVVAWLRTMRSVLRARPDGGRTVRTADRRLGCVTGQTCGREQHTLAERLVQALFSVVSESHADGYIVFGPRCGGGWDDAL